MTIQQRVQRELARLSPSVPSIRAMARLLAVDPTGVSRVYRRLGVSSAGRSGRPPRAVFAEGTVPIALRIPGDVFDHYSRVATAYKIPVVSVIRAHLVTSSRRARV